MIKAILDDARVHVWEIVEETDMESGTVYDFMGLVVDNGYNPPDVRHTKELWGQCWKNKDGSGNWGQPPLGQCPTILSYLGTIREPK